MVKLALSSALLLLGASTSYLPSTSAKPSAQQPARRAHSAAEQAGLLQRDNVPGWIDSRRDLSGRVKGPLMARNVDEEDEVDEELFLDLKHKREQERHVNRKRACAATTSSTSSSSKTSSSTKSSSSSSSKASSSSSSKAHSSSSSSKASSSSTAKPSSSSSSKTTSSTSTSKVSVKPNSGSGSSSTSSKPATSSSAKTSTSTTPTACTIKTSSMPASSSSSSAKTSSSTSTSSKTSSSSTSTSTSKASSSSSTSTKAASSSTSSSTSTSSRTSSSTSTSSKASSTSTSTSSSSSSKASSSSTKTSSSSTKTSTTSKTSTSTSTKASTSTSTKTNSTSTTTTTSAVATPTGNWTLVDDYSGDTFFDMWYFYDYADPTHGNVDYLNQADATAAGLAYINDAGQAITAVDSTNNYSYGVNRPSVRLQSKNSYSTGLVIWDIEHMPVGCAVWPALWSNGPGTWPNGGEIDLLEGVGDQTWNSVTLHTADGCNATASSATNLYSGTLNREDCYAYAEPTGGCAITKGTTKHPYYGSGVNALGGGIYAVQFDVTGITAWFIPRASITSDITNGAPTPKTWREPMAKYSPDSCDFETYFGAQTLIVTMTLCGDWAGSTNVYGSNWSGNGEGTCPGNCTARVMTGSNFEDAYFTFNSVKVYQQLS